ncbi:transposase, partial [Enterococcus faecium]|uniref:transposase n=1 Tax=Enterococcus faecium TaxID=1352 RepID=UPI00292E3E3A
GSFHLGFGQISLDDSTLPVIAGQNHKHSSKIVQLPPDYRFLFIPGVGKVYAAGLIAEIGQIERFEDQTKLAKYAGLSWKVNQSG